MSHPPKALERLRYWQGQTLKRADFDDELARQAALRWWHNRTIHDTWGLVSGLDAEVHDGDVVVGPGLAYDCFGRELVLTASRRIAAPPEAPVARWILLLRASAGTSSAPAAEIRWSRRADPFDPREGVPLAEARYVEGALVLSAVAEAQRSPALRAPRLGSGATVHGKTDWRPWARGDLGVPVAGVEVRIDTAAAGFERTPCYFAWLVGNPGRRLQRGFLFVPLSRVVRGTPSRFVFSIWLPFAPRFAVISAVDVLAVAVPAMHEGIEAFARRELSVCWLGIECPGSGPAGISVSDAVHDGLF
jgi:hypothetical protein